MNAISIEQDQQELKQAIEFQRNSNLEGLRLAWASLSCATRAEELNDCPLETAASFKPSERKFAAGKATLAVDFTFRVFRQDNTEPDVASVQCKFEADYNLRPGYEPAEGQIEAFQRGNAVFNCWPFFREYVQSSFTRMGFPAPPVPFLRMQLKAASGPRPKRDARPAAER